MVLVPSIRATWVSKGGAVSVLAGSSGTPSAQNPQQANRFQANRFQASCFPTRSQLKARARCIRRIVQEMFRESVL
jgi:hypothetical protein